MFSAFNPSKCTHLEQWAAGTAAPGEQLGVRCLAQGSHLSRVQFLLESRFELPTSGYKSALSIRATTAPKSAKPTTCMLDPILSKLLKEVLPEVIDPLLAIINSSLSLGYVNDDI